MSRKQVDHVPSMAKVGYGYTRAELSNLATEYAVDLGLREKKINHYHFSGTEIV